MWKILLFNALILIFFGVAVIAYPMILAVIVAAFFVVTGVWLLIWSMKLKGLEDDSSVEYVRIRTL